MSILKLILGEILFRKTNFVLSVTAVTAAVTLFVLGPTTIESYRHKTAEELAQLDKETTRIMRDLGFNLLVVHKDTDMADFWSADFEAIDMPQDYVQRLADAREITLATHIVATLQKKIIWKGRPVLLMGYAKESTQSHLKKKRPMGYVVEPGEVWVGHYAATEHDVGDEIDILGQQFRIAKRLALQGEKEDNAFVINLEQAQELLEKPGKVNQILALGCRCKGSLLPQVQAELEAVLPETKITMKGKIALARKRQRELVAESNARTLAKIETVDALATPVVLLLSGLWVGLLALSNVRERRSEIGLLRALGVGSGKIAGLFLGKAAIVGASSGVFGFLIGAGLAYLLGVKALEISAAQFRLPYELLAVTVLGAPLLSALASYLPTLSALTQDPALILREE